MDGGSRKRCLNANPSPERHASAAFALPSRCMLQVFGVFVGVLRVFPSVHHVRHKGLAEESRGCFQETDVSG